MRINKKILSIPPYISTSWKNISMVAMEGEQLRVELKNGTSVHVPDLDTAIIEEIFYAHEQSILHEDKKESGTSTLSFGFPLEGSRGGLDLGGPFGNMMTHNGELSHSPDLPKEMLKKVTRVAKSLGLTGSTPNLPKAEPHCNCPYCQIARSLFQSDEDTQTEEIEIDDTDLQFDEWIIRDDGSKQYTVIDPNDQTKQYHVYLGTPLRCTCGMKNCAHLQAVLRS